MLMGNRFFQRNNMRKILTYLIALLLGIFFLYTLNFEK
jgi:hypothetical protein